MRFFLGTAAVPVLQPLFLRPQSDAVSMLDTIYQEGFGAELVPFIAFLYSARYTGKSRSEAVQQHFAREQNRGMLRMKQPRAVRHPHQ